MDPQGDIMNPTQIAASILAFSAFLAGCIGGPNKEGESAPDFALTDVDGKAVSLASFSGKPVVIMFGAAVGCESCRAFSKEVLAPLAREHPNVGLLMISIQPTDTAEDFRNLRNDVGATWPLALDTDRVAQRYGIHRLTTVVVLDADHTIVLQETEPKTSEVREALVL